MSFLVSSEMPVRRRRRRQRRRKVRRDRLKPEEEEEEAEEEVEEEEEEAEEGEQQEEAWARPPSPRRGRWERPGPAGWRPEEAEAEALAPGGRRRSPSPRASWAGRSRSRSPGAPRESRAWGSPPGEDAGSLEEPGRQRGLGRWSSAKRTGGGRPRLFNPEAPSRQRSPDGDARAWGSPGRERAWEGARNTERPVWGEPRQGSPGGAGGRRWASAEGRKEPSQSPSRERRSLGSSGRDVRQEGRGSFSGWNQSSGEPRVGSSDGASGRWGRTERRGREHWSPTRKQSGVGSPQTEAREERWRNTRHHAREQSPVSPEEAGSREENYLNRSRDEGSSFSFPGGWQSPNEEARGQGSPRRYRGAENPDGEGAEVNSHKWGGEEKRMDAAGRNSPEASAPFTGPVSGRSADRKEWTPRESVVRWWMQCRSKLQKRTREQRMSLCPRPTLPDRSSETPQINPDILSLLNHDQRRGIQGITHFNFLLQEEVLDLLAPAMTIYEMAEEAMERDVPVDPMELREWSRHLLRFIGSIHSRLILQHRTQVLGCINPRLRMVASKLNGKSTEGKLFAEDKVELLMEILTRFPQLTRTSREMPKKNVHSYTGAASYKLAQRRLLLGSRNKPVGPGNRGTADQEVEQSHSQGAREEDPAKWH